MPDTSSTTLAFLPWVRQGAAAGIATAEALTPDQPAVAQLDIRLKLNDDAGLPVPIALRGPADVLGLDPDQVIRLEPRAGAADFEPNQFACIEFDRPDLPWLFTPLAAGAQGRLRPWLCLVVVARSEGIGLLPAGQGPLPRLTIAPPADAAAELPDLAESWAWAHAQAASGGGAEADVRGALEGRPERALSRLVCPRRLAANTDYLACVVSAFDLGRRAGLGFDIKAEDLTGPGALAPAWSLTATPAAGIELPVYHSWSFRTGAAGDFEALAKRLAPRPAPSHLGLRSADFGDPAFALPSSVARPVVMDVAGALHALDAPTAPPGWPAGVQAPLQTALAAIVNAAGASNAANATADPLLAPPLYGRWPAARSTAAPDGGAWFDEINLDPRWRAVAAYGVAVIQANQEALMVAAWNQAGALREANQRLRQLQLGLSVGLRLHSRHLAPLDPDSTLRVAAPALGRITVATGSGGTRRSLYAELQRALIPPAATSATMRRLGRARGPLTRRAASQVVARTIARSWISALNVLTATSVTTPLPGLATIAAIRGRMSHPAAVRAYAEVTAAAVTAAPQHPTFVVVAEGQPVHAVHQPPHPAGDSASAKAFRKAAAANLAALDPARARQVHPPRPPLDLGALRANLLAGLDPGRTLPALAKAVIAVGPATTPAVAGDTGMETLQMVPRFPQPMYAPLRDISQDLLLPGLDGVPPETVLGLKTNRRFVEAYMVGLNGEMGGELLWRGFATDMRGTFFDRFWDAGPGADAAPDIAPLTDWNDHSLGQSPAAAGTAGPERFVMLIRSTLLQRYPNAVIYAVRALRTAAGRVASSDAADEVYPVFSGSAPPDVAFFGFPLATEAVTGADGSEGYYLVIQEHPTEPRFGLAADAPASAGSHLSARATPPAGTPLHGLSWGRNGAHMAGITRRMPVRVAIHGSRLGLTATEAPTS